MTFDDQRLARVAATARQAVADPARWNEVLTEIGAAFQASGVVLFTPEPGVPQPLAHGWGSGRDSMDEYAAVWLGKDPWIEAASVRRVFQVAGSIEFGRTVLPLGALRRTAFHSDLLRRHDMEDLLSLKIADGRDAGVPATHLSLFRAPGFEVFGAEEKRALEALWRPLQRAMDAHWLLREVHAFDRGAEEALDASDHCLWVLRDDGAIEFANRSARDAMATAPWISVVNGVLCEIGDLDAGELRALWQASNIGSSPSAAVGLRIDGRLRSASLQLTPLRSSAAFLRAWPRGRTLATLRLPPTDADRQRWLQSLRRRHRLTTTELRVLEYLAAGHGPRGIATELSIAISTVRTHLGMLYEKTGCRRQAELVLLVAGG